MMKDFRTVYTPDRSPLTINHQSKVLTLGSCFAEVLGTQLQHNKFNVLINPFGIVYHPIALLNLLSPIGFPEKGIIEQNGIWFHYSTHSKIFGNTREAIISNIEAAAVQLNQFIQSCDILVLTFGSALGYSITSSGMLVSNCHKMPPSLFKKEFCEISALEEKFEFIYNHLKKVNPKIQLILTVSPVRHLKETLVLNSASKAFLRFAAHRIISKFSDTHYFPSYEIMMDDLRDYRYYQEDMIHPTPFAEKYIWGKFGETYFTTQTLQLIEKWDSLSKAILHKPFHPQTAQHKKFLEETLEKIIELGKLIPLEKELQLIKDRLAILS